MSIWTMLFLAPFALLGYVLLIELIAASIVNHLTRNRKPEDEEPK